MNGDENPEDEDTTTPGVGAELRTAREAAGLTARSVAGQLKLPESTIEALEADDFKRLPPLTFVRGYVRSYAGLLGLDPELLTRRMAGSADAGDHPASGGGAAVSSGPGGAGSSRSQPFQSVGRERSSRLTGWILAAVAAVMVAGAIWWLVQALSEVDDESAAGVVTAVESEADDDADDPAEIDREDEAAAVEEAPREEPTETADPPQDEAPDAAVPAPDDAVASPVEQALDPAAVRRQGEADGAPAEDAEDVPGDEAETPASPLLDEDAPVLRIRVRDGEETWLEVRAGEQSLRVGLESGPTVVRFEGYAAYAVVVGNADAVEVAYDNEPFDLDPHRRGNVARFTIGEGE